MKKLTTILLSFMLIASLFVSCNNEPKVVDETVSVTFDVSSTRDLSAQLETFNKDSLYWKYTATKADSNGLKSGETATPTSVKSEGAGLGTVDGFSQGDWKFVLYAYKDKTFSELVYQGETSATLKKGSDNKVAVNVNAVKTEAKGTLVIDSNIKLVKDGAEVDSTGLKRLYKVVSVNSTTDIVFSTQTTYTLAPGEYKVTVQFTDETYTYATGSVVATVYSNLKTTVSGTLEELATKEDFDSKVNPSVMNTVAASKAVSYTELAESTTALTLTDATEKTEESEETVAKVTATVPVSAAQKVIEDVVGDEKASEATVSLALSVDTTAATETTIDFEIGMSATVTTTEGSTTKGINDLGEHYVEVNVQLQKELSDVVVKHSNKDMQKLSKLTDEITNENGAYYYSADTGILTIKTSKFSPFSVSYDLGSYIVQVGTKSYRSLQEALDEVVSGGTIKLLDDIEVKSAIKVTKPVTLDLDNHALTVTGSITMEGEDVTITMKNVPADQIENVTLPVILGSEALVMSASESSGTYVYNSVYYPTFAEAVVAVEAEKFGALVVQTPVTLTAENAITVKKGFDFLLCKKGIITGIENIKLASGSVLNVTDMTGKQTGCFGNTEAKIIGGDSADFSGFYYPTLSEAISATVSNGGGGTIKLLKNVTLTGGTDQYFKINKSVTIDLGGYTLKSEDIRVFVVEAETLRINNGTIEGDLKINSSSVIKVDSTKGTAGLEIGETAKIIATNSYAISAFGATTNSSTIDVKGYIESYNPCVAGQGSSKYAKNEVTINIWGTAVLLKKSSVEKKWASDDDKAAIYQPNPGYLNVSDGAEITCEDGSAVEVRAGNVYITGGTFVSNATEYEFKPNGSGTTTVGAAIAIAQHTTKLPIDVDIEAGSFKGCYAFSLQNPEKNTQEDCGDISVFIRTGDTTLTATGGKGVANVDGNYFTASGDISDTSKNYTVEGKYKVGGLVEMGTIPSDHPVRDARGQNIEWRVLSVDENSIFVVSDKVLVKGMAHATENKYSTSDPYKWSTSAIRNWLNSRTDDGFITKYGLGNVKFDEISLRTYEFGSTEDYEQTSDKVFLLSTSDITKNGENLEYGGVYLNWPVYLDGAGCSWQLRDPGLSKSYGYFAYHVAINGAIGVASAYSTDPIKCTVDNEEDFGVRPAFWLNATVSVSD